VLPPAPRGGPSARVRQRHEEGRSESLPTRNAARGLRAGRLGERQLRVDRSIGPIVALGGSANPHRCTRYDSHSMTTPPLRPVDLRIDPRWILPIEPAQTLVDHALLVDAGRIVAVLPSAEADAQYAPRSRVRLPTHVLLPGLVNAHTHTAMTLLRGVADDVPLQTWLTEHIWPREARFVSPEFVHDGALLGAAEMLRGGVTCCNDMYFFPEAAARAYQAAGLRAVLGIAVLDFPTAYAADADGYLQAGLAARDAFKHAPRLTFTMAPHAPYTVSDATFEKIVTYARQLDLAIQTHLQETAAERDDSLRERAMTPLARLDRLGATGPGFIAIHAVHLGPGDLDILAAHRCHVVHCPTSNMKLASGIAPVRDFLARGINVALGSDGPASNNRLDIMWELRHASLLAKVSTGDAAAVPAAQALHLATLGGAAALGLDDRIGSLVAGKEADVIAIDLGEIDEAPCYDPVSHLAYVAGRERVTDVWVAGERVVEERRMTTIDVSALAARVRLWQQKLR
jgi:5-methylthioadenosine/S-adenosylhomocysteine deaminase